nr:YkvA family protein [uncultured Cohaesibacter sp.]
MLIENVKSWARQIKRDIIALWFAARHPNTPLGAKLVAAAIAAYALSPIDLIPDFIPIIGYLDDLLIVPAGVFIAVRLIPPVLMDELRMIASERTTRPTSLLGAVGVVILWILAAMLVAHNFGVI